MKRGKDDDKSTGPMFPRLHVNDTEKGGPRAPPRNKMALYEQLSIPSQRFNGGSTPGSMNNDRGTFSSLQQSSSIHPTRKTDTRHSDINTQRVQQEHKRRHEDDDFWVPIFDQQSGISQNRSVNHQNRENENSTPFGAHMSGRLENVQNAGQSNNKSQKENTQDFSKSVSNQSPRQNKKVPLKETNESSSFSHRNALKNGNLRDYRVDSQADNTLWGDSGLNESTKASGYGNYTSVPLREVQEEPNADAVSETSMVDSICGVDISPDDVVGIIGQKHFWKARRAIVNQQRVFAVQVFELHRLIKVQRLIAGSPQLLVEENGHVVKPPKVSPIKKIPLEYVVKSTLNIPKHKINLEKPNDETEFSGENAVGKASLSSVQNGSQTTNCKRLSETNMPWNYNLPPGHHQWLIPVMSPSEGLVYKPYPAPSFMSPVYGGGCGPPGSMSPMMGHNFPNYGVPLPSNHHYEGPGPGPNPFAPLPLPLPSHGYFPAYGMQMMNPSINPFNQASTNVPIDENEPAVPNVVKCTASKDTEVQASTASSRRESTKDRNALPLFPTSPPDPTPDPPRALVEIVGPPRVIRVVPHNAKSATASVARIFQSIQEERKQYDSR